jgi:nicotinate-nucleotide adenylyltransferase
MIALFGGTFDPVHIGHLNMAHNCVKQLSLTELLFLPCALPVHKTAPGVTEQHRLSMLKLAIQDHSYFSLDTREIERQGPSYSLLSIEECHAENPDIPLLFLMGMDSFNTLPSWYEWQKITSLCHVVVYQRPGEVRSNNEELSRYLNNSEVSEPDLLHSSLGGLCYFLQGSRKDVSSSEIRASIKHQQDTEHFLAPKVREYICKHNLYAD